MRACYMLCACSGSMETAQLNCDETHFRQSLASLLIAGNAARVVLH